MAIAPQSNSDWGSALFIGHATAADMSSSAPPPIVRANFTVSQEVAAATLYVTALGVYRPFLNGHRVGDAEFAPGWTDFSQIRLYQTYDATPYVEQGANSLAFEVGDGIYCGNLSIHTNPNNSANTRQYYGARPYVLAQLVIELADGTTTTVVTDGSWKATMGPVLASDWYMGETYDARLEFDFSLPTTSMNGWASVDTVALGSVPIVPQGSPVARTQAIHGARAISSPSTGTYIFDFGQNQAGSTQLVVENLPAGTALQIRHGEALTPSGTLYTANLRAALQTDRYIAAGTAVEVYRPHHTYHGFRYAELTGWPLSTPPPATTLSQVAIWADSAPAGSWKCSDQTLSQLWQNITFSHRSNWISIPSDCCQRDERMGWMADIGIFCRTATYSLDCQSFLLKAATDQRLAQSGNEYGDISPYVDVVSHGNAGWAQAGVVIPWTLWKVYGNTQVLTDNYQAMKSQALNGSSGNGYGDYLNINQPTDANVFATAWNFRAAALFAEIATALGNTADAQAAQSAAQGYASTFASYVGSDGTVQGDSQTGYVLGLAFGLISPSLIPLAFNKLVANLAKNGMVCGFSGLAYLLPVLCDHGQAELAFELATATAYPSWGYTIEQGCTTMPEVFNPRDNQGVGDGANSFNHFVRGSIGEWMWRYIAGIDIDLTVPGSTALVLRPIPGPLTFCEATWRGPAGLVSSTWSVASDAFSWTFTIPAGSTALVTPPGGSPTTYQSGTYSVTTTLGN